MGKLLNIVTFLHKSTNRDYLNRMIDNKVECMKIAKKYGRDYWDGDRRYGYGGYKYMPGRWKPVAEQIIKTYNLKPGDKVLDVGCGKSFLLYEMQLLLPELKLTGFDISKYGLANAHPDLKANLFEHRAQEKYTFDDDEFDLVISLTTLHNLRLPELKTAFSEIERVGKKKYVLVESFRNNKELFNLQCWALTCESFFMPQDWIWLFDEFGYTGDYEFIYFE